MSDETVLNTCGCCESQEGPSEHFNPPGLPAIRYRLGAHGDFVNRMLESMGAFQLPDGPNAGYRPLRALAVRDTSDPAIAFVDAWAATCDVLTFYQERIANESFLRTATERQSVLELARAIGYELNPGVAAGAWLQFTVDESTGAPQVAQVDIGVKVQSIPGPGELPQTFETIEAGETRAAWNTLRPQQVIPQSLSGRSTLLLATASVRIEPGDFLLVTDGTNSNARLIAAVSVNSAIRQTTIALNNQLSNNPGKPFLMRQRAAFFGSNAGDWDILPLEVRQAYSGLETPPDDWPNFGLPDSTNVLDLDAEYPNVAPGSWVFIVGGPQPLLARVNASQIAARAGFGISARVTSLVLDRTLNLSQFPRRTSLVRFQSEELPLADIPFPAWVSGDDHLLDRRVPHPPIGRKIILTGKRKRVKSNGAAFILVSADGLQQTAVGPEEGYLLLGVPENLDDEAAGLKRYHLLADNGVEGFSKLTHDQLTLMPPLEDDPVVSEAGEIAAVTDLAGGPTRLQLSGPITGVYERSTVTVSANVLAATHGETQRETLGSGNGAQPNQRFVLRRSPLTYVAAETPTGGASTLKIRVNGVEWKEEPSLYGRASDEEVYIVRKERDGASIVIFGDGKQGARTPSGLENVTSQYRVGIGPDGEVDAHKLALMQTRPFGMKSVTNPLAASGAAPPELIDNARQNAPMKVLTLDRVVSIRDYEDLARAFSGIGKARVDVVWSAGRRLINLTLATASGDPIDPDSALVDALSGAINLERPFRWAMSLAGFRRAFFRVNLNVRLDSRYIAKDVLAAVRTALTSGFSFANRQFAQPVTAAEIFALVQQVSGVVGVDINQLYRTEDPSGPSQTVPPPVLFAGAATVVGTTAYGAELLLLDPNTQGITLQEVS